MTRSVLTFLVTTLPLLSAACMVGDAEDGDEDLLIEGKKTAEIRVVQHNIEKRDNVLADVVQYAKANGIHAITLQELCPPQVAWLHANYDSKWTISDSKGKRPSPAGCDLPDGTHDYPYSVAIWTGGTGGKKTEYRDISTPNTAPGTVACVEFERAKVPVHVCSVHLISADWRDNATGIDYDGAAIRLQETTHLKQIARDNWFDGAKNHFGIIAGDFNGQPNTEPLDKLYDGQLGGTGDFTEYNRHGASRDGKVTAHSSGDHTESGMGFDRKIDYVFFSTNRAPLEGEAAQVTPDASDHDMVVSTVQMRK
jgi:endonuclease/exonuclease/phosphatase family metal-dependent hydrolase